MVPPQRLLAHDRQHEQDGDDQFGHADAPFARAIPSSIRNSPAAKMAKMALRCAQAPGQHSIP
jgi:hypothetical protein